MSLIEKYNSFQKPAVASIVRDFTENRAGRYLLVIPTGGGKTYTAVKSVCALFDEGVLNIDTDQILWLAHRNELLEQAKETFSSFIDDNPGTSVILEKHIQLLMVNTQEITDVLRKNDIKLVVIDEAHHAAASSYQPAFECSRVGILGLTATPSRHDGAPLDFEFESFSVGFPDLVKKGLILRPIIRKVDGGEYSISSLTGAKGRKELEALNNAKRNAQIISELEGNSDIYKKVIIFVGTIKHVKDLHAEIMNSELPSLYENIDCITGSQFSSLDARKEFIAKQKEFSRSIVINVAVLTEGYDDATVNTVVMAAPTKSKLYYMQAAGRAVRMNEDDPQKKAYIIEVEDTLPNIEYKIDNRWLFSDVSDALEPSVEDITYCDETEFETEIQSIYKKHEIDLDKFPPPPYNESDRLSLLLFNEYKEAKKYETLPLFMNKENRLRVRHTFNFISERMPKFHSRINSLQVFRMVGPRGVELNEESQKVVYGAMNNAFDMLIKPEEDRVSFVAEGAPWIKYISFRFEAKEDSLDLALLEFLNDVVNRSELLSRIVAREYEEGDVLIKLPLPLEGFIGKIVSSSDLVSIESILSNLRKLKEESNFDHYFDVYKIVEESNFPLELRYGNSLLLIVRDNIEYSIKLGV